MRQRAGHRNGHRAHVAAAMAALGLGLALILAACSDLTSLNQDTPSQIGASDLEKPENAELLVRSAVGDFECALTNYVLAGGLVSDELANAT